MCVAKLMCRWLCRLSPGRGWLRFGLLLLWLGWAANVQDTLASPAAARGNRYLFVVDTTSSMTRLGTPLQKMLSDLIAGGLEGWMRTGDTYGLWMVSDRLLTDYPMQVWDESRKEIQAANAVEHLKKQRLGLTGLTVTADPTQAPEPPWAFTHIHLHYVVTGRDLDPAKVERAIKLSQDKYCSVAATIRGVTEITFDFEVRSEA